jgi:hypothetical protein
MKENLQGPDDVRPGRRTREIAFDRHGGTCNRTRREFPSKHTDIKNGRNLNKNSKALAGLIQ